MNLKSIVQGSATIKGEIRGQIQARFASMIAGLLEKIISTKGLFGLALAPIAAAGASQCFNTLVPKFATGGDFVTSGPQMIMVGDNPGGRERVEVTPLSSPNIDGPEEAGNTYNISVTGNVLTQDFVEEELAESIRTAVRRGTDFGIS